MSDVCQSLPCSPRGGNKADEDDHLAVGSLTQLACVSRLVCVHAGSGFITGGKHTHTHAQDGCTPGEAGNSVWQPPHPAPVAGHVSASPAQPRSRGRRGRGAWLCLAAPWWQTVTARARAAPPQLLAATLGGGPDALGNEELAGKLRSITGNPCNALENLPSSQRRCTAPGWSGSTPPELSLVQCPRPAPAPPALTLSGVQGPS